jgi:hypothetical protein
MSASADFQLSSDGGSNYQASNASLADSLLLAYASTGNYSIKARLTSTADVVAVGWSITTADDEHLASLPAVTSNADKTCDFLAPKTGGAWILKATVTDGSGTIRTNTLAVKVAPITNNELIAAGEGTETGSAGWIRCFNDLARAVSAGGARQPATDANTLIHFPLTDAAGTTSIANAGTGSAFTLDKTGTATFGVPTPTGDGLLVVGASYFDNSSGSALTYQPATTAMTVSCWVEFPNPNSVATSSTLWSKPNGASDATFAILVDTSGASRVFLVKCKVATTGVVTSDPFGYATPGRRYYLVATFDGANMKTYINGILAGSKAAVGAMSWDNAKSFTVGCLGTADTYVLSDCRLDNATLTLAQIKADYTMGAFGR